mmetsp:Transcript_30033/g.72116  ORF Transcript_30033/g.72116 Transcript_30033/m.72116 type:complete len:272 (-) Transcript_30033:370-1185(-)
MMSCCDSLSNEDSTLVRLLEWITEFSPRQNYGIWLYMNGAILLWSLLLLAELCLTHDLSDTQDRIEGTEAYLVYSFGAMLMWVLGAGLHLLDHVYVHQIAAGWSSNVSSTQQNDQKGQEEKYYTPEEEKLLKSCIGYNSTNDTEPENDAASQEEEEKDSSTPQNIGSKRLLDLCAVLFEFILSVNFLDFSRRAFKNWNTPDNDVADELVDILINIGAFSYQVVRIWKIREEDIARELAEIKQGFNAKAKAAEGDTTDDDESNDTTVFEEIP